MVQSWYTFWHIRSPALKIYLRMKAVKDAGDSWRPDANGTWQYVPVPDSVGKPPQWVLDAEKKGVALFYLRPGGERYSSREAAKRAAKKAVATSAAVRHGLSLTDADPNRQSIRSAVEHFLERKSRKAPRTVRNFEHILTEFIDWLPYEVRFVDQVTSPVLLKYQSYVESLPGKSGSKASPKTVHNKLLVICFMLKSAGVARPSHMVEFPTIEEEIPEPYSTEELGKLFSAMDSFNGKGKQHEDADAFKFFLASACREQEVAHATWRDIDWAKGTYTVAAKTWNLDGIEKRFTPKNHERRTIPLTIEVMKMLRSRAKSMTGTSEPKSAAWIFPNSD